MKYRQSTLIGICVGLQILFCGVIDTAVADEIDVREAQLFLDDGVIESSTLVERVMHQPIRHPANPLLSPEEPWEGTTMNYLSGVFRDEESGLFRVFYVGVEGTVV